MVSGAGALVSMLFCDVNWFPSVELCSRLSSPEDRDGLETRCEQRRTCAGRYDLMARPETLSIMTRRCSR